jgi:hypothetical protein
MINIKKDKNKIKKLLIVLCLVVFAIGYYFLTVVSRQFKVPLGNTFHVIFGCSLMAISGIYIVYTVKQLYFRKKKTRSKRIFLKDDINKNKE